MFLSNLLEVIKKEVRQLIRDRRTLALVILQPILIILFFGFCTYHDISNMDTFVFLSNCSPDIVNIIEESGAFHVTRYVNSTSEIYNAIKDGKAKVGIICNCSGSVGFNFTFIYDSTNLMIDGTVKKGIADVRKKLSEKLSSVLSIPVQLEPYFGEYRHFEGYAAGILCLTMFWVCISIVSLSVIVEKTSGTIERLLAIPYSRVEMIIGKLIGNIMVAVSAGITSVLVFFWILGVDVKGGIPIIISVSILIGIISLGHGLLISAFVKTEREAVQVNSYFTLIYLLLSNILWPVETMHWSMTYVRLGCFLTYAVNALNGIMLRGYSVLEVGQDIVILGIFGLFFLLAGILAFRKRL